jgi:hypothetical protein
MGSILMNKEREDDFLEIPPNEKNLIFDDAVAELKKNCQGIDLDKVTSIKYHTNTWGLSSNNWFADEIITKLSNLQKIDFSDTVNYRHRSDLCLGIKSMLLAASTKNI